MKDIIQQIMNQENLDEIYGYAQNALFKDGPVSITTLEILSYLKLFAPDYFSAVEEEILSIMGIFYKKPTARTLQSKLFELYSEHIRQTYHHVLFNQKHCLVIMRPSGNGNLSEASFPWGLTCATGLSVCFGRSLLTP